MYLIYLSFTFIWVYCREIKILKNLSHPNIVKLKEIVTSKATDANKQVSYT